MKSTNSKVSILRQIWSDRKLLFGLARNDFKSRFANSFLGVVWAYVQPLVTMLVFWYVFQIGLRNSNIDSYPFIVWYAPAFLVWTFFADTLSSMTNSLMEYSYLVKKVNFNVAIIPSVKLLSGIFVHTAFLGFIVVLNCVYHIPLSVYYLQVFYYFFCTVALLFAQGMLFAAIMPFFGDMSNLVGVILQVGFWATPIVWNSDTVTENVRRLLSYNPMYYICNGYRDSFLFHVGFWEQPIQGVTFWVTTLLTMWLGLSLFRKLRSDFVDVM